MSTGTLRGQEGQPLVIGDMMYFESSYPNFIYAVDLDNVGRMVWKFAPEQDKFAPSVACCDVVNRGLAYADGKILATTLDTHVYALDAKTGQVIWKAQNGDPEQGQTMTMAPLVVHDKVIVGISGGEFGVRGSLTAYDLGSGKMAWRAYSVGPDEDIKFDPAKTIDGATQAPVGKDSSIKTWQGDEWKLGGGTTWGWYSYDPDLNLVYYGTGNPGTWNPTQRPGDNKWSTTIIARNPDTGVAAWAYQMTPHDAWDYDGINESVLTDTAVDGQTVPTLTHFDRNGFAYVLDRRNGKLLRANKFDPSTNWAKEIDLKTGPPGSGSVQDDQGRCQREGHLPGRHGRQEPSARLLRSQHQTVLRSQQPHLHGLPGVQREVQGWLPICGSHSEYVSRRSRRCPGTAVRL